MYAGYAGGRLIPLIHITGDNDYGARVRFLLDRPAQQFEAAWWLQLFTAPATETEKMRILIQTQNEKRSSYRVIIPSPVFVRSRLKKVTALGVGVCWWSFVIYIVWIEKINE